MKSMKPTIIILVTVLLVCCNLNGACIHKEETISPQQLDINPYKKQITEAKLYISPKPEDDFNIYRKYGYFSIVEIMPQFPGGMGKYMEYIKKNIKYPYPSSAKTKREGRVIVRFIVKEDGSIINAQVVRNIDPLLDEEAIRVIYTMPRWEPGKTKGYPVNVRMFLPVIFKIPAP